MEVTIYHLNKAPLADLMAHPYFGASDAFNHYIQACHQHYSNLIQFNGVSSRISGPTTRRLSHLVKSCNWLFAHQWYKKVATLSNLNFINEGLLMSRSKGYPWWLDVPSEHLLQPTRDSTNLDILSQGDHAYLIVTGGYISLKHQRYMCFDSPID